jgi:hypothetical protein
MSDLVKVQLFVDKTFGVIVNITKIIFYTPSPIATSFKYEDEIISELDIINKYINFNPNTINKENLQILLKYIDRNTKKYIKTDTHNNAVNELNNLYESRKIITLLSSDWHLRNKYYFRYEIKCNKLDKKIKYVESGITKADAKEKCAITVLKNLRGKFKITILDSLM